MIQEFRSDINGLRALAVIVVVLYHFGVYGITGGYVGVDIFFVISGYLMTKIITEKISSQHFSVLDFYAARVRRIVPALIFISIILMVFGAIFIVPIEYKSAGKQVASAVGFTSNYIFWRETGYFDVESHDKWLLHTWSLSVEWQFYVIFPLLVILASRFARGKYLRISFSIILLTSLITSMVQSTENSAAAYYLLPARAWEFLAGGIVFFYPVSGRYGDALGIAGLLCLLTAVILYRSDMAYPGYLAVMPVAGTAVIIAVNRKNVILDNRFFQFFGNISYSFYLWHWPIIVAIRYFEIKQTPLITLLMFVGAVIAAFISYQFIEMPFRRRNKNITTRNYLVRYAIIILLVGTVAGITWLGNGFPQRAPANLRDEIIQNATMLNSWEYPGKCKFINGLCELGSPAEKKVIFWGDSHIEQWYPALKAIVDNKQTNGKQVVIAGAGGCIPIRGLDRTRPGYGCDKINENVFSYALRNEVSTIVIGSIWSTYFRDDIFTGNAAPVICEAGSIGCRRFSSSEKAVAFSVKQLRQDVEQLLKANKKVYIVLPVPIYRYSIPIYLSRHYFSGAPLNLDLSLTQHRNYSALAAKLVRDAVINNDAVILDPALIMCPVGECLIQENGISLYMDSNHLAATTTLRFVPLWQTIFR